MTTAGGCQALAEPAPTRHYSDATVRWSVYDPEPAPPLMPELTLTKAEHSDRDLVAQMVSGEESAVAELYDRFCSPLYSLAHRVLGERADAEEAVMEAFAQAWRTAGQFDRQRGSVGAWLTIMVRSRSLDIARAKVRRERMAAVVERAGPEHAGISVQYQEPDAATESDERRQHVQVALRELSTPQRKAIELAYFGGLSHSEIARRLDTPLGTIKTRIRDGMRKLRDTLRPQYAELGR